MVDVLYLVVGIRLSTKSLFSNSASATSGRGRSKQLDRLFCRRPLVLALIAGSSAVGLFAGADRIIRVALMLALPVSMAMYPRVNALMTHRAVTFILR
jgi:hypothetical protein